MDTSPQGFPHILDFGYWTGMSYALIRPLTTALSYGITR